MRLLPFALPAALLLRGPAVSLEAPVSPAPSAAPGAPRLDPAVDPCADFYRFACGTWIRSNPVPREASAWDRFEEAAGRNREALRSILEAAAVPDPRRDAVHQKIGDAYASCMDEGRAEADGARPVAVALARIEELKDGRGAVIESARQRRQGLDSLLAVGATPDARDGREVIAELDEGGLGLPDRDDYLDEDAASRNLRQRYTEHVGRLFRLAGDTPGEASAEAARVMAVETALARGSQTRAERHDPARRYARTTRDGLRALAPSVPWDAVLGAAGLAGAASVNVASPGFVRVLDGLLATASLEDWKSYLRWHVLHDAAPWLSPAFVDEDFAFYGRTLTGARELPPRWQRCVTALDLGLRDLVGRPYVEATRGEEAARRALELAETLRRAMDEDLAKASWMDDETREKARAKLRGLAVSAGRPDRWADAWRLAVNRGSFPMNRQRMARFQFDRMLASVGRPTDRAEWRGTAAGVNASYDPKLNRITLPAGLLQPPFLGRVRDDASDLGALGALIGHEMSHAVDDVGRLWDADGSLKAWGTDRAAAEFRRRAACVERHAGQYVTSAGVPVDGARTLGENLADIAGLKAALGAFLAVRTATPGAKVDGSSPEQRFFLGWASLWCRSETAGRPRSDAPDDAAPASYRVNGPLSGMKEFQAAFSCRDGTPMVRTAAQICEVW